MIVSDVYLSNSLKNYLESQIQNDLLVRLELVQHVVTSKVLTNAVIQKETKTWDSIADELGKLAQARVTIINNTGIVLGDSEIPIAQIATMENHDKRPEIITALNNKYGVSSRYSTTIKSRLLYVAKTFAINQTDKGFVRLALPLIEIDASIAALRRLLLWASLLTLIVAIVLSAGATQLASRSVRALTTTAKKMAAGDLSARTNITGHDELAALGYALTELATNLSRSLTDLRSERDLQSGILTGMREGILLIDKKGAIALTNPAFREMFLISKDSEGKPLLDAIRHAELKSFLDHAAQAQAAITGEISAAGLKPRRLLLHAAKVGFNDDLLCVFFDVTDIRRLESLRKNFVANVSHELRTPVACVRSALETLQYAINNDPKATADFIEIIERNTERLHHLIEDLLDLSHIESQQFSLNFESVALISTLQKTIGFFANQIDSKNIKITTDIPENLPMLRADHRALEQALSNLIDNAIKYCPSNSEISISAAIIEKNIRITIADNGPGIEAKHLPRLFERFYRVDTGRSRELGGTGLGLSIVKHLIEAMGGKILVESIVGKGTKFELLIPLI
ncbi:MAG: HAMP domain-containing protein [Deltaproteobacteria bacterium]|nr:HAMP domain-containing protein [Deltaproteobacteria bacterium]